LALFLDRFEVRLRLALDIPLAKSASVHRLNDYCCSSWPRQPGNIASGGNEMTAHTKLPSSHIVAGQDFQDLLFAS